MKLTTHNLLSVAGQLFREVVGVIAANAKAHLSSIRLLVMISH